MFPVQYSFIISSPPVNSSPSCLVEVKQDNFTAYKICGGFCLYKIYNKNSTGREHTVLVSHFVLLKGNKALSTYLEISSFRLCVSLSAVLPWKGSFTYPPTEIQKFTECFLSWVIFNYIRKEKRILWSLNMFLKRRNVFNLPKFSHLFFFFWLEVLCCILTWFVCVISSNSTRLSWAPLFLKSIFKPFPKKCDI